MHRRRLLGLVATGLGTGAGCAGQVPFSGDGVLRPLPGDKPHGRLVQPASRDHWN